MKKILISLVLANLSVASYAYTTVNLNNSTYKCAHHVITNQTTESQIKINCKNVTEKISDDVKDGHNSTRTRGGGSDQIQDDNEDITDNQFDTWFFTNDADQHMKCLFKNSRLIKCKILN